MSQSLRHAALALAPLLAWVVLICPADAATHYVKPAGDDAAAGTNWATALATVTNALNRAAANDEIWVAAGTYKPTTAADRTKSITLKANVAMYGGFAGTESALGQRDWSNNVTALSGDIGTADDLTDNVYHVVVGATGARLDGFTVRDGYADGAGESRQGGGMYSSGVHPITANCLFTNNYAIGPNAGGSGGAGAYWYQGTYNAVTVGWYNCVFDGNMASNSTTGANSYGGGLHVRVLTNFVGAVSNCLFRNNRAAGTYATGAGLALTDDGARAWPAGEGVRVIDCVFSNNVGTGSSSYGGGARVGGFNAPVTFTNCLFVDNDTAVANNSAGGGAMYVLVPVTGQGLRMLGCTFLRNRAGFSGGAISFATSGGTNSLWRDCLFLENFSTNHGGGMTGAIDGTFDDCRFISNGVLSYNGAAVRIQSAGATGLPTFTNCLFFANVCTNSTGVGGALSAEQPARLVDCRFIQNRSGGNGGAVNWAGGGGRIEQCIFVSNSLPSGSTAYGGALRLTGTGRVAVEDSTFSSNAAGWYGGAIHVPAGAALSASDCSFVGNAAIDYYGGAALIESTNVVFRRCVFVGNSSSNQYGGALCYRTISTHTSRVEHCVFRDNVAKYGGAIAAYNANITVSNCTAFTNRALNTAQGGALYHLASTYTSIVENCIFWNNTAAGAPHEVYQPVGGGVGIAYSCVQGGAAGPGNVSVDPQFDDPTYLHLKSSSGVYRGGYFSGGAWEKADAMSPVIDLGNPASPYGIEPDPNGSRINLGAYGNTAVASKSFAPPEAGLLMLFR